MWITKNKEKKEYKENRKYKEYKENRKYKDYIILFSI